MTDQNTAAIELLDRALVQAANTISGVRPEQVKAPTPCGSWNVTDLTEHLVTGLDNSTVAARGGSPDWSAKPDVVRGDPATAFRERADALLAAWSQVEDFSTPVKRPSGDVPMRVVLNQQLAEIATHTWDLARATDQPIVIDEAVATAALDWARGALAPGYRGDEASGKAFGPEVTLPADAPAGDQLVAWFGRSPDWSAR